jgi:hypothetical protein
VTRTRVQIDVARPAADVTALLATRPTGWLRGFLQLATTGKTRHPANTPPAPQWYRVGHPYDVSRRIAAVPLIWWPHADSDLFRRFEGEFTIESVGNRTQLAIEGEIDGGIDQLNDAVFASLLRLLDTALTAPLDQDE